MLEVRDLIKTYIPKKGVPVVALNKVNLTFEEKGMVFVLGKSGSGKSTLLNLLGGLDEYDSGDILVKGKSTKRFKQKDFDSYRNTFVGFIFQEYNLIDDMTVGANIGLAIELQGRKANNEEVNKHLKLLDLEGFGARKTNELSGGQKQRIAIARALVKNPDIILADEPTGALDSKTGEQIFKVLKKLSKEKLVIVVSHDRDFAERYADRIIELADGEVINDVQVQMGINVEEETLNVKYDEDEGLIVKEDYELTLEDLKMINYHLKKNGSLKIVEKDYVGTVGGRKFVNTEKLNVKNYDGNYKMIKSKLPFNKTFKMGVSGLINKKIRLVFTILLSLVAFTLFGITDSMASYDKINAATESIIENEIRILSLVKNKNISDGESSLKRIEMFFDEDEIANLSKELGYDLKPVVSEKAQEGYPLYSNFAFEYGYPYFISKLNGFFEINKELVERLGFELYGEYPKNTNEIVITKYIFEHFQHYGYKVDNIQKESEYISADKINKYSDIIGKTINIIKNSKGEYTKLKITGILDTKFDSEKYSPLKTNDFNDFNYLLFEEMKSEVYYGYHTLGFVNKDYITNIIETNNYNSIDLDGRYELYYKSVNNGGSVSRARIVGNVNDENIDNIYFFDNNQTTLEKNEIIIHHEQLVNFYNEEITYKGEQKNLFEWKYEIQSIAIEEFINNEEKQSEAISKGIIQDSLESEYGSEWIEYYRNYLYNEGFYDNKYAEENGKEITNKLWLEFLTDIELKILTDIKKESYFNNTLSSEDSVVVGFILDYDMNIDPETVIVDNETYSSLMFLGEKTPFKFLLGEMPENEEEIRDLLIFTENENEEIVYSLKNKTTLQLELVNDYIEELAAAFLYIGIGFAIFSSLMLSNFISVSINAKRKVIGILRALGARSKDVYKIFLNESIFISLINFVISSLGTFVVVQILNETLKRTTGLTINVFNFSIRQVILLFGVSIFVSIIASFIPVNNIARKKPVDAINHK